MIAGTRILLVEDDAAYARLLQEILVDAGEGNWIVEIAGSLRAARERAAAWHPNVVLLDLGLPDAEGVEVVTEMRSIVPRCPIVVLSGYDDIETALASMRNGAQEYLVKGQAEHFLVPRALRYATERKRMQDFEQLLIGVVGHDLRGPLQAIQSGCELLDEAPDTGKMSRAILPGMLSAVTRANALVNDLLTATRARAGGRFPIERQTIDCRKIVDRVIAELRSAHPSRTIEITRSELARGHWDPHRLAQVLDNLVGNALQHSPVDSAVSLSLRNVEDDVVIEVHNSGEPIPPKLRARLFEPLERASMRQKGKRTSIGLGLYISHEIVTAHGGTIEVESSFRNGTTFRIVLPRQGPSQN